MLINDYGVRTYYRKEIIKEITWENVKYAKAFPAMRCGWAIVLAEEPLFEGKEEWKNNRYINIKLEREFYKAFMMHVGEIKVGIKDFDKILFEKPSKMIKK